MFSYFYCLWSLKFCCIFVIFSCCKPPWMWWKGSIKINDDTNKWWWNGVKFVWSFLAPWDSHVMCHSFSHHYLPYIAIPHIQVWSLPLLHTGQLCCSDQAHLQAFRFNAYTITFKQEQLRSTVHPTCQNCWHFPCHFRPVSPYSHNLASSSGILLQSCETALLWFWTTNV